MKSHKTGELRHTSSEPLTRSSAMLFLAFGSFLGANGRDYEEVNALEVEAEVVEVEVVGGCS